MANFLSKLFGTKSDRDLKEVKPYLDATLKVYPEIQKLTNDQLRAKTIEFKERIRKEVESEENELATLRQRIEEEYDMPIDEKEEIYKRIDKLEKDSYDKTQKVLNDILPEAFSVVKETARRFAENSEVVVTATDHDRELAVKRDSVNIVTGDDGQDKAVYQNQWMAGGNMITWDMVHYDVQLIGGVVLHSGKIAEMATGEGKTLVATLPVYLNALPGKGVHVVTVNDYLAKRDSEWMGMLFEFHGLTVDCIDKHEPHSDERKAAYNPCSSTMPVPPSSSAAPPARTTKTRSSTASNPSSKNSTTPSACWSPRFSPMPGPASPKIPTPSPTKRPPSSSSAAIVACPRTKPSSSSSPKPA